MSKLYIMIGLPGSGKDFISKQIVNRMSIDEKEKIKILSSDDLRIELFGFEDQTHNDIVFQKMNQRCKEYLSDGLDVIYNATNLNKKRRMSLISNMKKYYDEVYAILCLCSIGTIYERNFVRFERHIPEDKIFQMFKTMDIPLVDENYNKVYFINTDSNCNFEEMSEWIEQIGYDYDQQNEHHNEMLLNHLYTTARIALDNSQDEDICEAGRFHDIGKPYAREWNDVKNKYTYYEHHRISAYLYLLYYTCKYHIDDLEEIPKNILEISTLIYHHMDKFVGNLDKTKELIGDDLYKKLEILMMADEYREE